MYNRSVICKVANNLRKKGYTLSAAFRAAWRLAKSKAAVKVAGMVDSIFFMFSAGEERGLLPITNTASFSIQL